MKATKFKKLIDNLVQYNHNYQQAVDVRCPEDADYWFKEKERVESKLNKMVLGEFFSLKSKLRKLKTRLSVATKVDGILLEQIERWQSIYDTEKLWSSTLEKSQSRIKKGLTLMVKEGIITNDILHAYIGNELDEPEIE